MRISDWSSDVCSSDLELARSIPAYPPHQDQCAFRHAAPGAGWRGAVRLPSPWAAPDRSAGGLRPVLRALYRDDEPVWHGQGTVVGRRRRTAREAGRSEEHTSELQSLMRISYAVFCLKKNKKR